MCVMKLILRASFFLTVVCICTIAQNDNEEKPTNFDDDTDIIIDPLTLVLKSSDAQGFFYCNGRVDLNQHSKKLVTELVPIPGAANTALSTVGIVEKRINATTVGILIVPNGYIGINKVNCHWAGDEAHGQTADLIIGENPGLIELKYCRTYDRRYVECIFYAPITARAFRNGFPPNYIFQEFYRGSAAYGTPVKLVNITDANELVFHFIPQDRTKIPPSTPMMLNVTLSVFGSSSYRFNLELIHTTNVDFKLQNISSDRLNIYVKHSDSDTRHKRLCSGSISQVINHTSIAFQDIIETPDRIISIRHLRPSSQYSVCLRCYYQRTDESFNEKKCQIIQTPMEKFSRKTIAVVLAVILTLFLLTVISVLFMKKCHFTKDPSRDSKTSTKEQNDRFPTESRYTKFSVETDPLTGLHDEYSTETKTPSGSLIDASETRYSQMPAKLNLDEFCGPNRVTADTIDLSYDIKLQLPLVT